MNKKILARALYLDLVFLLQGENRIVIGGWNHKINLEFWVDGCKVIDLIKKLKH